MREAEKTERVAVGLHPTLKKPVDKDGRVIYADEPPEPTWPVLEVDYGAALVRGVKAAIARGELPARESSKESARKSGTVSD